MPDQITLNCNKSTEEVRKKKKPAVKKEGPQPMRDGRRFRIYPNQEQARMLSQWIGCQRVIQGAKIDEVDYQQWLRRHAVFNNVPVEGKWAFDQAYSHFKTELNPWLGDVPSQILRNGTYRAKAAFQRYWSGLGGKPKRRHKSNTESVIVTSELFQFRDDGLYLGSTRTPQKMQRVRLNAHRKFDRPKMIAIVRELGQWFVSFSFADNETVLSNDELLAIHAQANEEEILALDRGVVHPFYDSEGRVYDPGDIVHERICQYDARRVSLQRKLAGQKKGSKRRNDTKKKLARVYQQKRRLIGDWRHKTTHAIAKNAPKVAALENLNLAGMTRAPKPKEQTPCGVFPKNGRAAKAGLNRVMLQMGLGIMANQLLYKLNRQGKALVLVPAHHSSQECSRCEHTSEDNRTSQAEFYCQACGFTANADYNASLVQRRRAWHILRSDGPIGSMETLNAREGPIPSEKPPA